MSGTSSPKEGEDCLPRPIGDIDLKARAEALGIKYFLPCFCTLKGSIRADLVPRNAAHQLQTQGFASMVVGEAGVKGSDPEAMLVPDPATLIQLPWDNEIGWLACNWYFKGKRFDQCPRYLLQKQCEKAKEMGFVMKTGIEPEFVLLAKDNKHEVATSGELPLTAYQSAVSSMQKKKFLGSILDYMDQLGWEPYQALHEFAPSQYEINWKYSDALTTADRYMFFKFMIKEVGQREGFRVSFMPLPFESATCINGLHIHVSLWTVDKDENVFPDAKGHLGLSSIGRRFMAGALKHSKEMCGLLCTTVNSYKRLFAWPNFLYHISYGRNNRWALIRIPGTTAENDRFEYRSADGAVNPYILHAAMLAAGLDGIKNKTELDPKQVLEEDMWEKPEVEGYEDLPGSLIEAHHALKEGSFFKEQLGPGLIEGYLSIMRAAWKTYNRQISPCEIAAADYY